MAPEPFSLDRLIAEAMGGNGVHATRRWAASGAMALTGPADEAPDAGPARIAVAMDALAADIAATSTALGARVELDGAALLGERAAIAGLKRRGATSCGGATRLLRAADDTTVALSLARDDDLDLLPALHALLGHDPAAAEPPDEVWVGVAACAAHVDGAAFVGAAGILGLPAALCGEVSGLNPLVRWTPTGPAAPVGAKPIVVDLSSLWAGPLCANVLGLAGLRVVKVESIRRPDGARSGPAAFFDLLHGGHDSVAVNFDAEGGRAALRRLVSAADVVIEASRPRALAGLGVAHEDLAAAGWRGTWLSITGHGRNGPAADRVAFGDDAAVAGGLVGPLPPAGLRAGNPQSRGTPRPDHLHGWFVGDAIADPATGLLAAAAVLRALGTGHSGLIEVSLATTAAHLALGVAGHPAPTSSNAVEVSEPRSRPVTARAARLGEHNTDWLG